MPSCLCCCGRRQRSPLPNHKCTQTPTGGEFYFFSVPCLRASMVSSGLSKKIMPVQTWHIGHEASAQSIFAFMWNLSRGELRVKRHSQNPSWLCWRCFSSSSAVGLDLWKQMRKVVNAKLAWCEVGRLSVPLHHCLEDHFSNANLLQLQVNELEM